MNNRKRGSNQYRDKWGLRADTKNSVLLLVIFMLIVVLAGREWTHLHPIISPCPEDGCGMKVHAAEPKKMTVDEMVDFYAKKFGNQHTPYYHLKVYLHFLLDKEASYGDTKSCGDSGLACGPLQFHETTYQGFRKIMMAKHLVSDVGSRLDLEDAIETTAWAISDGRENNWGPIARGEIKI